MIYRFLVIVTNDDIYTYINVYGEVSNKFTLLTSVHTSFFDSEFTPEDIVGGEINYQSNKHGKNYDIGKVDYQTIYV
jgi:hypothetical protein